jgi:4-hydroxy-tetrahydrodipicolinate reductase
MKTRILVTGSKGRMGTTILKCASEDPQIEVSSAIDQGDTIDEHLQSGVVIIDFTIHTATESFLQAALKKGSPMVIGTTGFSQKQKDQIASAARSIPIMMAPNMSIGVNLLFSLTQKVASILENGYDMEIIEKHHRHKKDAPSGTAARLLEILAESKKKPVNEVARHGREGMPGARTRDEIGVHAIRGGDYVGEHTVIFASEGDVIELTHKASSREIFAKGALHAAKWLSNTKPGFYDMFDVLGLRNGQ